MPVCIHALHCLGRDATVPTRPFGDAKPILELVLNSDASRSHFGGAQALSATRYGARFPRYVGAFLGVNQSASEAHPGQLLSVLAELSVPLTQAIHLNKESAATLQIVLDDLIANLY